MSLHLVRANALFLHIPKTGGTWVGKVLKACGIKTEIADAISPVTWRHSLPSHYTARFTSVFAFVRHPLSWYESWWKFQAKRWIEHEPGVWHPQRVLEHCESDDFSQFIRLCIAREPAYVTRMYEWYLGPPGFTFVDTIGRYENLADDLIRVLRSLAYEFDEAVIRAHKPENVSAKRRGEPVWDEELKKQVLALEAPTVRRFYGRRDPSPGHEVGPGRGE